MRVFFTVYVDANECNDIHVEARSHMEAYDVARRLKATYPDHAIGVHTQSHDRGFLHTANLSDFLE